MEIESREISFSWIKFNFEFYTVVCISVFLSATKCVGNFLKKVTVYSARSWKLVGCLAFPIILLPVLSFKDTDSEEDGRSHKVSCAYTTLLISLYWTFKVVPVAIPSLLPVLLFPLFGIMDTSEVTTNYMRESNMMLIGGLTIALAVEHCKLNKRICFKLLIHFIGDSPSPQRILFAIMSVTALLSMWTSNAGTTLLVVPIALSILDENTDSRLEPKLFNDESRQLKRMESIESQISTTDSTVDILDNEDSITASRLNLKRMYLLGIAYSSNIGGTGTILGSGTNYIIVEILKSSNYLNKQGNIELNLATWMLLNIPAVILNVALAYVCLLLVFNSLPKPWQFRSNGTAIPWNTSKYSSQIKTTLTKEFEDLGPITFQQIAVGVLFFCAIFLLFFRDPRFMGGWVDWISEARVEDSTPVILVVFLLFIIPKNLEFVHGGRYETLLQWTYVEKNLSWGLVLMSGGAFALSDGASKSGFSDWLGKYFEFLEPVSRPLLLLMVLTLTTLFTEIVTNRACASIILPVLIALSKCLRLHPLYLGLPTTVMCSFGFMLPIATNPNSIVFSSGKGDLRIGDMLRAGVLVNCICILVVFMMNLTVGEYVFKYSEYNQSN